MEENVMLSLEEFLQKYGFNASSLTTKEKLKVLKQMYFTNGVDRDWEELKYSKIDVEHKTEEAKTEFVTTIENLEIDRCNILSQIVFIKRFQKEERKLQRKRNVQKVLKFLKGRD